MDRGMILALCKNVWATVYLSYVHLLSETFTQVGCPGGFHFSFHLYIDLIRLLSSWCVLSVLQECNDSVYVLKLDVAK